MDWLSFVLGFFAFPVVFVIAWIVFLGLPDNH